MRKSNLHVVSFTNHLGQTIEPGQRVIAVSEGYNHLVKVREAVYEGVSFQPGTEKVQAVKVTALVPVFGRFLPSGKKAPWPIPDSAGPYETRHFHKLLTLSSKRIYPTK